MINWVSSVKQSNNRVIDNRFHLSPGRYRVAYSLGDRVMGIPCRVIKYIRTPTYNLIIYVFYIILDIK